MGTVWVVAGTEDIYLAPGIPCIEAVRVGTLALTFEIVEGGRSKSPASPWTQAAS